MMEDQFGTTLFTAASGKDKELLDSLLAKYHGRHVKNVGPACLCLLENPTLAFAMAMEFQTHCETPAKCPMAICQGEIRVLHTRVLGEMPHLLCHMAGMTPAGDICFAEHLLDEVKRLSLPYEEMGTRQLQEVSRPIRLYSIKVAQVEQSKAAAPVEVNDKDGFHPQKSSLWLHVYDFVAKKKALWVLAFFIAITLGWLFLKDPNSKDVLSLRSSSKTSFATLVIRTNPDHAEVFVGGRKIGARTPVRLESVSPNISLLIRVTRPGFVDVTEPIVLKPGEKREITYNLKRKTKP